VSLSSLEVSFLFTACAVTVGTLGRGTTYADYYRRRSRCPTSVSSRCKYQRENPCFRARRSTKNCPKGYRSDELDTIVRKFTHNTSLYRLRRQSAFEAYFSVNFPNLTVTLQDTTLFGSSPLRDLPEQRKPQNFDSESGGSCYRAIGSLLDLIISDKYQQISDRDNFGRRPCSEFQ